MERVLVTLQNRLVKLASAFVPSREGRRRFRRLHEANDAPRLLLPDGEMTETSALDEFLEQARKSTFAVSGMIFQDAYNLDLDRLKRCYICEVDSEYGMVPFCAYNLTDNRGVSLYRK